MKIKVKIIKCSGENYWYKDSIGEEYDIYVNGDFRLTTDSKYINMQDCEIVTEAKDENKKICL